jgi:hypothetical protein
MIVHKRAESIQEQPDGRWLNRTTGRYHKSAVQALQAVRRRDKACAKGAYGAIVTVIEWHPRTRIGTAVVKGIT